MKRFIVFIFIPILMVGQEAWAEDQPGDLGKTDAPPLSLSQQILLKQQEMTRLVSDVVNGRTAVMPSMVPPEIFDRIYCTEKQHQEWLVRFRKDCKERSASEIKGFEMLFYMGQLTIMRDLLYIVGVLPESVYSLNLLFNDEATEVTEANVYIKSAMAADRMRLITTMLLLLNYKEPNPIPPGDIVQATPIIK